VEVLILKRMELQEEGSGTNARNVGQHSSRQKDPKDSKANYGTNMFGESRH